MIFDKLLLWFAEVWIGTIILINAVMVVSFIVAASTISDGTAEVAKIYSPFNPFNWMLLIVSLLPAIGALLWRQRRQKRRKT